MSSSYVQHLKVSYSEPPNWDSVLKCFDGSGREIGASEGDCNKGFGGEYVFLVPSYTNDRNAAAKGFQAFKSGDKNDYLDDLAKGSGGDYRYQSPEVSGPGPVVYVAMLRSDGKLQEVPSSLSGKYAYMSNDINQDRGGDYLHIIWGPRA